MTGNHPVLLLLDFQHGTVERNANDSVVRAARRALDAAREHAIPVIFVRLAFRPGYPEAAASNLALAAAREAGDAMTTDHPYTQIHARLTPLPDEPVVVKRRVSAFAGTDLEVLLRAAGGQTLVLAGLTTSGVVLSTLRDAADRDYRVTVLEDACGEPDGAVHNLLMTRLFPRQATVTTTQEWAATL